MNRDIFQAIADPTRREILVQLAYKKMTPNSIADKFVISRQAVSKHIKILLECNLLNQEKVGREIYYDFNPEKMQEVDKWVEQFRKLWENKFDQLDNLLKK
ncbi:metalloregulator ArsR/SmtB family transcription factor [bacterium BMS3Abin03]|jgi:DNA-binding transcriptional ArsR family regulator|nr:metalloregulator ArsR/SmtB family transcription factor [bacterium BMS3Abin03]